MNSITLLAIPLALALSVGIFFPLSQMLWLSTRLSSLAGGGLCFLGVQLISQFIGFQVIVVHLSMSALQMADEI